MGTIMVVSITRKRIIPLNIWKYIALRKYFATSKQINRLLANEVQIVKLYTKSMNEISLRNFVLNVASEFSFLRSYQRMNSREVNLTHLANIPLDVRHSMKVVPWSSKADRQFAKKNRFLSNSYLKIFKVFMLWYKCHIASRYLWVYWCMRTKMKKIFLNVFFSSFTISYTTRQTPPAAVAISALEYFTFSSPFNVHDLFFHSSESVGGVNSSIFGDWGTVGEWYILARNKFALYGRSEIASSANPIRRSFPSTWANEAFV